VAFELARGTWSETVLHRFTGKKDGWEPGQLSFDQRGELRGNAGLGGKYNSGGLFTLKP